MELEWCFRKDSLLLISYEEWDPNADISPGVPYRAAADVFTSTHPRPTIFLSDALLFPSPPTTFCGIPSPLALKVLNKSTFLQQQLQGFSPSSALPLFPLQPPSSFIPALTVVSSSLWFLQLVPFAASFSSPSSVKFNVKGSKKEVGRDCSALLRGRGTCLPSQWVINLLHQFEITQVLF